MPYSKNLSFIHDQGFGELAKNASIFISQKSKDINKQPFIVDLGCGSGIMAKELIKKGGRVYGIDISKEMIAIAQKKAPQAKFKVGSFLDEEIPTCDVISGVGEVFNYLFDKKIDLKSLNKFFRKCHKALKKNGILIFDIMEFSKKINHNRKGFKIDKNWAVLSENIVDPKTKILKRVITSFVKHGKNYERTDETHEVLLLDTN